MKYKKELNKLSISKGKKNIQSAIFKILTDNSSPDITGWGE